LFINFLTYILSFNFYLRLSKKIIVQVLIKKLSMTVLKL